jgi:uncharacterized protein YjaZ
MLPVIHLLASSARLRPYLSGIRRSATHAISRVRRKLSIPNVDIVIVDDPRSAISETGVGGFTPNAYTIYISLDPLRKQFRDSFTKHLPRTLAHELHHAARWKAVGYGRTLHAALITEGLAGHFELEVFGGLPNPWDRSLRSRPLARLLGRAKREFSASSYDHDAWFFGSSNRNIPRWTGYAIGFELVRRYLASHPKQSASILVGTPASTFR